MNLFPEHRATEYINKLLYGYCQSGLPFAPWRITPEQVKEHILDAGIAVEDVKRLTHEDIVASVDRFEATRKSKADRWRAWHLRWVIEQKLYDECDKRMDADKQASAGSRVKPKMVQTQEQKDQIEADARVEAATMAEQMDMVHWAQRKTGRAHVGFTAAYLIRIKYDRENKHE